MLEREQGRLSLIEGTHTLGNEYRDFPEWHRGRSPYVFWGLDVDFPEVRALVRKAGERLAGFLLEGYCRQPHVTLDLCGFPSAMPNGDDEFSRALVLHQSDALRAGHIPSFELEIGGLASFTSAPFLRVEDPAGGIVQLRDALAIDGRHRLFGHYVPHVTVGLYADDWPVAEIAPRFAEPVATVRTRCPIERICLMSYSPAQIGGVLSRVADFELASRELRWHCSLP